MPYKNPEDEKACRVRNRHKKNAYIKRYRAENPERMREKNRVYYRDNKEKCAAYGKEYFQKHPEKNKAAVKKYLAEKRLDPVWNAKQAARYKQWRDDNPDRNLENRRAFYKRKAETDANFVIVNRLRARLTKKLKCQKAQKATNTMALTGCTREFLRGYLEAKFEPGMTWKTVHIDHHVPCAEFDLRDPEQQKQCFHFSNLKPMWPIANMRKGTKRPPTHQAELI